jgi:aminobenzoyl-glutamate utilization protein A
MHGCTVAMQLMGGAAGCENDAALVERIQQVVKRQGLFSEIVPAGNIGGSEDCTYFMERVQKNGGQAAFVMIGTKLAAGHHDSFFDFDEGTGARIAPGGHAATFCQIVVQERGEGGRWPVSRRHLVD